MLLVVDTLVMALYQKLYKMSLKFEFVGAVHGLDIGLSEQLERHLA